MARKKKEKKVKSELDTETTFADMNVEGFRWYDPSKKSKGGKQPVEKVSRKEYWAMVRGAFAAMLPFFLCLAAAGAFIVLLAWLWLK